MEQNIGALWLKDKANGGKYLTGNIEIDGVKHKIVVFKNDFKKDGEKTPDYRIFPARQQESDGRSFNDDVPF
jgi:uncharacterized protein (DUF736 family)